MAKFLRDIAIIVLASVSGFSASYTDTESYDGAESPLLHHPSVKKPLRLSHSGLINGHLQGSTALRRPLRVGITEMPPLLIFDQPPSPTGFMVDLFRQLKTDYSLEFDWVVYESYLALLKAAKQREVDVVLGVSKTLDRMAYLDFTPPIVSMANYLVVTKDAAESSSVEQLHGQTIGIVESSFDADDLASILQNRVLVKTYPKASILLTQLVSGEVAAAIMALEQASYYLKQPNWTSLKLASRFGDDHWYSIATRSDKPELNLLFERMVTQLEPKQLAQMKLKWGLAVPPSEVNPNRKDTTGFVATWVLVAGLLLITGWSIMTTRRLRQEIAKRQEFEALLATATARIQAERNRAQLEARTDALTGVFNRRKFNEYLQEELSRYRRKQTEFCVMMIDLDYFKLINDEFGHDVGDQVLKAVSQVIQSGLRPYDHLGRVGGEEFAVILPNTGSDEAMAVADRLLDKVMDYRHPDYPELSVTVSIGVTQVKPDDDLDKLMKRADQALYQSKENGRNRATLMQ
jgi:diguanylate cyclase (GGDEF)-like protein